jgi:hypothetical protein
MNVTFFQPIKNLRESGRRNWNNQEIADFYRAMGVLRQAGLDTSTDFGVTDEGDPWFVFLKADSGDVIAHFAKIDGQFIAVSALSREVYRGTGIREIVDKMLERHPLLIPQRRDGGRLLLHPTAALTAFLAAAFILNIDGTKASNIAEIISASGASSSLVIGDNFHQQLWNQRHEPIKLMFSDVSATNYNIAILGAALIAHELAADVPDRAQDGVLEDYGNADTKTGDKSFVEAADYTPNHYQLDLDSASERLSSNLQKSDVVVSTEDAEQQSSKKEQGNPGKQKAANEGDLRSIAQSEVTESVIKNNYSADWSMPNLIESDVYLADKSNLVFAKTVHEELLAGRHQSVQENSIERLEPFEVRDNDFTLESSTARAVAFADVIETEIVLSGVNDRQLFAVGTSQLEGAVTLYTPSPLSIFESDSFGVGIDDLDHTNDKNRDEISALGADSPTFNEKPKTDLTPILGHSFFNPDAAVEMTEAIDVVFFRGGYAEIKGFELGKDLLWFFLPENVLAQSNNAITEHGDLLLDFGDAGALKFLGVVQETMTEVPV